MTDEFFTRPFRIVDGIDTNSKKQAIIITDAHDRSICRVSSNDIAVYVLQAFIDQQQLAAVLDANEELKTLLEATHMQKVEEVSTVVQDYDKIIALKDSRINELIDQCQKVSSNYAVVSNEISRINKQLAIHKSVLKTVTRSIRLLKDLGD